MSYCKKGENSDVYVYRHGIDLNWVCHECSLKDGQVNYTAPRRRTMLRHLKKHIVKGHKVPNYALQRLALERRDEKQGKLMP